MILADGYIDVPPGKLAAIVTHLQMMAPAPPRPGPPRPDLRVRQVERPEVDWYRALYRRVGEPWLWESRLKLAPAALAEIVRHPRVEIFSLMHDGADKGLLELDFRIPGHCELAFFGVALDLVGSGAGRLLMNHAIARAWSRPIARFWVHTCTNDHPGALAFYIRSGFQPFRRQIEITDESRLDPASPAGIAPHVPIVRG
ncbi:MAG: GNAT family N-acetyltransferase [Alphaproteobacteria bacterium]|nr:GNAT family N-acetyltransferase [Alphaproteobacteria bacterium]